MCLTLLHSYFSIHGGTCIKLPARAGKMAQWLKLLAALPRDIVQFTATIKQLTTISNSNPKKYYRLLLSVQASGANKVYIVMCTESTCTNKREYLTHHSICTFKIILLFTKWRLRSQNIVFYHPVPFHSMPYLILFLPINLPPVDFHSFLSLVFTL